MSVNHSTATSTNFPNNDPQAKTCCYQPWVWVALAVITTLGAVAAISYGLALIPDLSPLVYGYTVSLTLGIGLLATAACLLDAVNNVKWSTVKEEEIALTPIEANLLNFVKELEEHQTYLDSLKSDENQKLLNDDCKVLRGEEGKKQRDLCVKCVVQSSEFLDSEKNFQTQQGAQTEMLHEGVVNEFSQKHEDIFTELEATKEVTTQKIEIAKQILKNLEEKAVNSPILKKTRSRINPQEKPVAETKEIEIDLVGLEKKLIRQTKILMKMHECLQEINLSEFEEDDEDGLEEILDDLAFYETDQNLYLWLMEANANATEIGEIPENEKTKEIFDKYSEQLATFGEIKAKTDELLGLVRQRNEGLLESNVESFIPQLKTFYRYLKPLYEDNADLLNDECEVLKGEERQAQRRLIPDCIEQINGFLALEGLFQAEQRKLLAFFDADFVRKFSEENEVVFRDLTMVKKCTNEIKRIATTIQKKLPVFNSPLPIRTRPKSPQQKMDERLNSMAKILVTCQSMTYDIFKILATDEGRWQQIQNISVELGNYADDEEKSLLCIDRREGLFAQVTSIRWLKNLVNEIEAVRLNDGTDLAVDATGILKTRLEDLNLQIEKLKEKKLIPLCKLFIEEIRKVESEYLSRKAGHSDLLSLQKRNKAKIAGDKGSGEES